MSIAARVVVAVLAASVLAVAALIVIGALGVHNMAVAPGI
jgi:hypothetical protein